MKNKLYLITVFILLILSINLVSAFILEQHIRESNVALSETQDSFITQSIKGYEDYFLACNLLTDISVVYYFQPSEAEDKSFIERIFSTDIGQAYRNTHSVRVVDRALSIAKTPEERACAYGVAAHHVQDTVSHNKYVPNAIIATKLPNGIIHSVAEIKIKDMTTSHSDFVQSREVLLLGYEMSDYLERVFADDPTLSRVDIPGLIDFFIKNTVPNSSYTLGFRSFFALPQWIYWFLLITFLISIASLGFITRRIINNRRNLLNIFVFIISLGLLIFISLIIFGLLTGNLWRMWEVVSQVLFSPLMYPIGIGLIVVSLIIGYLFIKNKGKREFPELLVAVFILILGISLIYLPSTLVQGNEQQIAQLAVDNTKGLLSQGTSYLININDPVGAESLKHADEENSGFRLFLFFSLFILLISILFFTFKRKKKR